MKALPQAVRLSRQQDREDPIARSMKGNGRAATGLPSLGRLLRLHPREKAILLAGGAARYRVNIRQHALPAVWQSLSTREIRVRTSSAAGHRQRGSARPRSSSPFAHRC